MSLVIVYHISDKDREDCWLVDEVIELTGQEIALYRSERHVITLKPEDYQNGLCIIDPRQDDVGEEDDLEPLEFMQRTH